MMDAPQLTEEEYRKISSLIQKRFGISLGAQKQALVAARLQQHLLGLGFTNFSQYLQYVTSDTSGKELAALADRISTNHTYFNRESAHFRFFNEIVIPYWDQRLQANEKMRIWSAGCSSGEEAYQLAMILLENFGPWQAKNKASILATDISRQILQKAEKGLFSSKNVENLPKEWIRKYFVPKGMQAYEVRDELKEMILFRRLNLIRPIFPFKRKFHAIFCRNVMIYFDALTRQKLISRFHQVLETGGFLFIGHSENLDYRNPYFKFVKPSIFIHEATL